MDSRSRPGGTPSLLPILRSQQQGEILAMLLDQPERSFTIADIARVTGVPYPSAHREVDRAERAGIVFSNRLGNARVVRANRSSPYFDGLASVLVRAFGPPAVLAKELATVNGVSSAYLFGSWAAQFSGEVGMRKVDDIDLLVLGDPNRNELFTATAAASERLGRTVDVTIREPGWLEKGDGHFHTAVTGGSLVPVEIAERTDQNGSI